MVKLLIVDQLNAEGNGSTKFGGRPVSVSASRFEWPVCASCKGNMQYLGQIAVPDNEFTDAHLLQLFMCQNDPGMCYEWDAEAGGNRAVVLRVGGAELSTVVPPDEGDTERGGQYGVTIVEVDGDSYDVASAKWMEASGQPGRLIAGQLFGTPAWIQVDETPSCSTCGTEMHFVAQIEEGPDIDTSMNFGGGSAYVFECRCGQARLLWQQ